MTGLPWANLQQGPSPHLAWHELACHDAARTPYPIEWRLTRLPLLVELFERIRAACGDHPIQVTSAYRTLAHNTAIGGTPGSQHLEGRALDLKPPQGMSVAEFYEIIRQLHRVGGLGRYRTFVHVDVRPTNRLHAWHGGAALKDDRAVA